MEIVLTKTETQGAIFSSDSAFLVSLHGTFTGETFVYCVPKAAILPEDERVDVDWIKAHDRPLTADKPTIHLAGGEGYLYQIRAANAGALGVWTHSVQHSSKYQG